MGSSQIEMDKETFEKFLKVVEYEDKKEKEYSEQVCEDLLEDNKGNEEGVYKLVFKAYLKIKIL